MHAKHTFQNPILGCSMLDLKFPRTNPPKNCRGSYCSIGIIAAHKDGRDC